MDESINNVTENGNVVDEMANVADTGRLFVRNLPFSVTEDELREIFVKFGPIAEVFLRSVLNVEL